MSYIPHMVSLISSVAGSNGGFTYWSRMTHMRQLTWSLLFQITHWGRVTHICVGNLTIIGSDNGLSRGRRQAIIWTNDGILFIGPLGTNFSEILIEILTFSFQKMRLKVSSEKWRPFCLGLNVIMAFRLFGTKPLSESMMAYRKLESWEQASVKSKLKYRGFHSRKCLWKYRLQNSCYFASNSSCFNVVACSTSLIRHQAIWTWTNWSWQLIANWTFGNNPTPTPPHPPHVWIGMLKCIFEL